jgi:hypothetical protein
MELDVQTLFRLYTLAETPQPPPPPPTLRILAQIRGRALLVTSQDSKTSLCDPHGKSSLSRGSHCKAGPHRIGIHNTSKGINRYFLRI